MSGSVFEPLIAFLSPCELFQVDDLSLCDWLFAYPLHFGKKLMIIEVEILWLIKTVQGSWKVVGQLSKYFTILRDQTEHSWFPISHSAQVL